MVFHNEDGNPARANIKQALGNLKDGDGDGNSQHLRYQAQGRTIPNVGVYLSDSVFSHGQLYVALSRGISRGNTKVLVKPAKKFDKDGVYTSNVVYQEVLRIEPKTYFEASQHKLWVDAMNIKMDALYKNNTWELVDLPIGRKAIGSKRVSKIMHNISLFSEPKDNDPLLENVTDYQKLIGKLIYLTTTRPDITYTVSCLSLFIHSPLKSHLKTALKFIRLSLRKLVAGVSKLGKDERLELSSSNS
ncbi:hypothetical protein Tco_0548234 [Tanacetum coccineum]